MGEPESLGCWYLTGAPFMGSDMWDLKFQLRCLLAVALAGGVPWSCSTWASICRQGLRGSVVPEIGRHLFLISPVTLFPRAMPGRPHFFPADDGLLDNMYSV